MEDAIIETKDLTFSYPADEGEEPVPALRGVDLAIERGSFVVVLGHNGSGKSTLAKTFNGVLLPTGGHVYVDGMDTADEDKLLAIRRTVGMVFQNPDNQIVANVVEEDVAFAPENLGVPTEEIRRRVDEALRLVDMSAFVRHAPHLLSGGQICSPAAKSSASPSLASSPWSRRASCWTRPPPCWIRWAGGRCSPPSTASTGSGAPPWCSSPTT